MALTIKELKEIIKDLPDNCVIKYVYDGPETYQYIEANEAEYIGDVDSEYLLIKE